MTDNESKLKDEFDEFLKQMCLILGKHADGSGYNPGAITVTAKIAADVNGLFILPRLSEKFERTQSDAPYLWIVYKDICKYKVDETIDLLRSWLSETEDRSLDAYIKEKYPTHNF